MVKARSTAHIDVRQAALDTARRLFAERGFDGTAIQDVATAVGVSKQAVLHHFASKEELREAVLAELISHWGAVLPRLLLEATGGYHRFTAVFGELVRFFSEEPAWAKLVVREILDRPEHTQAQMKMAVRPWIDAVANYVHAGQDIGILRDDVDPAAWATEMLLLILFGAAAHPVLAGAIERQGERRLASELNRIAQSSLFKEREGTGRKKKR